MKYSCDLKYVKNSLNEILEIKNTQLTSKSLNRYDKYILDLNMKSLINIIGMIDDELKGEIIMKKCDNCRSEISNEDELFYCVVCGASVCACCIGDNYDDICRDCEE